MAKFHLTPKGQARQCSAKTPESCRYSQEAGEVVAHYDTKEEAQAAYETQAKAENGGSTNGLTKKKTVQKSENKNNVIGKQELNRLAKTSDDQKVLMQAAEVNSTRMRDSLLSNPKTGSEVLLKLKENAVTPGEKNLVIRHKNFPVNKMTKEEFEKVASIQRVIGRNLSADYDIDDEKADYLVKGQYDNVRTLINLATTDNKISYKKRKELIHSHPSVASAALEKGYVNIDEFKNFSQQEIDFISVSGLKNKEFIDVAVEKMSPHRLHYFSTNETLNAEQIDRIIERTDNESTRRAFYGHKNISDSTKMKIEAGDKQIQSLARVNKIADKNGGMDKLRESITKNTLVGDGKSSLRTTIVEIDKNKVKELGLSKEDVETLMGYGRYNHTAEYNEEAGSFRGVIDSSD